MAASIPSWNNIFANISNKKKQEIDQFLNEKHQKCINEKIKCICQIDVNGIGNFICKECGKMFAKPSCGDLECLKECSKLFMSNLLLVSPTVEFPSCPHGNWRISFSYFPNKTIFLNK